MDQKLVAVLGRDAGPWLIPLTFEPGTAPIDLTTAESFTLRVGPRNAVKQLAKAVEVLDSTTGSASLTAAEVDALGVGEWFVDFEIVSGERQVFVQDEDGATQWPLEVRHAFT
jgi:hypothetical protein